MKLTCVLVGKRLDRTARCLLLQGRLHSAIFRRCVSSLASLVVLWACLLQTPVRSAPREPCAHSMKCPSVLTLKGLLHLLLLHRMRAEGLPGPEIQVSHLEPVTCAYPAVGSGSSAAAHVSVCEQPCPWRSTQLGREPLPGHSVDTGEQEAEPAWHSALTFRVRKESASCAQLAPARGP